MNIKSIMGTVLLAGASMYLTSCYKQDAIEMFHSRKALIANVMSDKPQQELDKLMKTFKDEAVAAQAQHAADSIIFRYMFDTSQKANDSAFVAEYNEMMNKTRTPLKKVIGTVCDNNKLTEKLHNILSVKEMKEINNNPLMNDCNYFGIGRQYLVDSVYHHKFFEKHNLLDSEGKENFKTLCDIVRP